MNSYLAHSPSQSGKQDPVRSHLSDVASSAAEYAKAFGAADEARIAGLLHDLGKYGCLFQRRLEGKEQGIDHWSPGAWEILMRYELLGLAAALAVQGHHIGLQRASKDALSELNPDRLQNQHPLGLRLSEPGIPKGELLRRFQQDGLVLPELSDSIYKGMAPNPDPKAAAMLDVRMLFSALVDADFIETEAHFQAKPDGSKGSRELGPALQPESDLVILLNYLERLAKTSTSSAHINHLRADLLQACLEGGVMPQGLFTLTAPTGTGKTLSMLAFALKHAITHGLRRVVMVIPFLSIIEQTVREYRKVFEPAFESAELVDRYILENHSLAGTKRSSSPKGASFNKEEDHCRKVGLLAENWDAPIVVTTSVQLLESLFANRPSACRKLHRLARSVILFDEVQTIPVSLAVPTLATLSRLAERYQATIVFSTATQPAFTHLDEHVKVYCSKGWTPREIVLPKLKLFDRAKRTKVEWPKDSYHPTSWKELAEQIAQSEQSLCIVNLKRHALGLVDELERFGVEGLFHLSTSMCPSHRQVVLDEVRQRLKDEMPCCLISTQCVEAGVDVDFPVVFRAWGPLDAIAQAAGRCNRNGHAPLGTVHLFFPEEEKYPDGSYGQAASVTRILMAKYGSEGMDIHSPALFEEYYRELYDLTKPENMKKELMDAILRQDFAETAKLYRIIEQRTINVLVPYSLALERYQQLAEEVRGTGLNRKWIAKARPYTIGLFGPRREDPVCTYLDPIPMGAGEFSDEWFIYLNKDHYSSRAGLVPPASMECLIA